MTTPPQEPCNTVRFSQKKKKEEEAVLNTVLNTGRTVKSFSVKGKDCNTLKTFMEMALRERKSFEEKDGFSSAIIRAMKEYIEHHPIPNPNCTLDRIFTTEMPARSVNECVVPNCNRKAKILLTLRDYEGKTEKFPVCPTHKTWLHPRFRWLECWRRLE